MVFFVALILILFGTNFYSLYGAESEPSPAFLLKGAPEDSKDLLTQSSSSGDEFSDERDELSDTENEFMFVSGAAESLSLKKENFGDIELENWVIVEKKEAHEKTKDTLQRKRTIFGAFSNKQNQQLPDLHHSPIRSRKAQFNKETLCGILSRLNDYQFYFDCRNLDEQFAEVKKWSSCKPPEKESLANQKTCVVCNNGEKVTHSLLCTREQFYSYTIRYCLAYDYCLTEARNFLSHRTPKDRKDQLARIWLDRLDYLIVEFGDMIKKERFQRITPLLPVTYKKV